MTAAGSHLHQTRSSFDPLLGRLERSLTALGETELLKASHWELGQDARLREDMRFRQTPWGRWMRSEDLLANDAIHRDLHTKRQSDVALPDVLEDLEMLFGRRCVFCPGDSRFVHTGDNLRLAASELSTQPVIEDEVGDLEKYTTHLPMHSLKAAAASEPAEEWGAKAQEQLIETLGWVQVSTPGKRLNARMFVARIQGRSMDDGRSGLIDGGYAIFELWPAGTKQLLNVLVRGSFHDPETGSYAVKKYVADQRDAQGGHHQISLVSLNPDKERYPNIELDPEDEDALAVVAKVVQPLAPDDYARCPKPLRRKGRRDFESDEGLLKVHERLSDHATRFFNAGPTEPASDTAPDTESWNSQLVCLDAESGGLHLEVGPLTGLWKFVKVLVARAATGASARMLASNARLRPVRAPVRPADGAWAWVADGFEEDPDVDLSVLDLRGVPHDRVTAFRVGADGVGRIVGGARLSPGQHYRILVPPEIWDRAEPALPSGALSDGWRLVDLALVIDLSPDLQAELLGLGVALGDLTPSLGFGLASLPDEWRATPRGEPFACFRADEEAQEATVLVTVDGYDAEVDDEALLFVHSPNGLRRISLPAGRTAMVELSDAPLGEYFCSLLHQRTRVQPAHLPFEVAELPAQPPAAKWVMAVDTNATCGQPNTGSRAWVGDLARLETLEVSLDGPPGWTIRVLWREIGDDYMTSLTLDEAGQLDVAKLLSATRERRRRSFLGDLVLDLGELGSAILQHERLMSAETVETSLRELVAAREKSVRRRAGAYAQLLPTWFQPVGQCLGYEVVAVDEDADDPPPVHAAAARLLVTERRTEGISRRCKRVLVMIEELTVNLDEDLLAWIDRVCLRNGADSALISTGLEWAEHRRRSRLPLKTWDLAEALDQPDSFIAFLRDMAEGV